MDRFIRKSFCFLIWKMGILLLGQRVLRELNKTVHILGLAQAARPPKTVTIIITTVK